MRDKNYINLEKHPKKIKKKNDEDFDIVQNYLKCSESDGKFLNLINIIFFNFVPILM